MAKGSEDNRSTAAGQRESARVRARRSARLYALLLGVLSAAPALTALAQQPVAHIRVENGAEQPLPFRVVTPEGEPVAESVTPWRGALLPPGDYLVRAAGLEVPVTITSPSGNEASAPPIRGLASPSPLGGDNVNAENANLWLPQRDGRLTRWYNSRSQYDGPFGYGWTFFYGTILREPSHRSDEYVFEVLEADGASSWYLETAEEGFLSDSGSAYPSELHRTEEGFRRVMSDGGERYLGKTGRFVAAESFDEAGRLLRVEFATGEAHEVRYRARVPSLVVDALTGGELYRFETDGHGRIVAMTDPAGRNFSYRYSGDRLARVTGPEAEVTRYSYDDLGNLTRVVFPDGSEFSFSYDRERDWLMKLQGAGLDYSYEYGEESPGHLWTTRTSSAGDFSRWDYHYDSGTSLVVHVSPLERQIGQLLGLLGLDERAEAPDGGRFPLLSAFAYGMQLQRLGRPGLRSLERAVERQPRLRRERAKHLLTTLMQLRLSATDLAHQSCRLIRRLADHRFPSGQLLRLDRMGRVVRSYPFAGLVAPGALTPWGPELVIVGDLAPFHYRILELSTGRMSPADEEATLLAHSAAANVGLEQELEAAGYWLLYHALAGNTLHAVPVAEGRERGYTVHLNDYGSGVADLGLLQSESLILAARSDDFPALHIDLASGEVRRLGSRPVLDIAHDGQGFWLLHRDRAVRYDLGLRRSLAVPLPRDAGPPQGFAPLQDGTLLVSFLRGAPAQQEGGPVRLSWPGCGDR